MSSRQNRRPFALVTIVPPALLLALVAGCRDGGADRSVTAQAAALEASFPGRSAAVVRNGLGFTATASGFTAAGVDQVPALAARGRSLKGRSTRRRHAEVASPTLSLEVPADATQALRFRAGGSAIAVRELDARGEAHAVEQAVGYPRVGGTSFWTTLPCGQGRAAQTACGAEEWLRFERGVITDGTPAATWEITGATLVERGAAIEVTSDDGATRLRVTAPAAYAEGGAPVEARLQVAGGSIQLFVEAGGRGVLVDPVWTKVAPMPGPLEYPGIGTTGDGRVLVTGGDNGDSGTLNVAYLYDPKSDAWTTEPAMTNPREDHTSTTLPNGQVLVAGGDASGFPLSDADLFDPTTETWTNSQMPGQHSGHTATLLKDGTVLIAGGFGSGSCGGSITLNNVDLFDPALGLGNMWSSAAPLNDARSFHAATRLQDGRVLVTGGEGDDGTLSDCEIYDPVQKTWTFTEGSLKDARENHTATLLPDGTVLVVGGDGQQFGFASAEIYDPVKDTWSPTGSLATGRSDHQMVTLSDGRLLVAGGSDGDQSLASTEIYDPAVGTWSAGPTLTQPREEFVLAAYGNSVIAAGGWQSTTEQVTASAEVVLFGLANGAACLTPGACNSGFCNGAGICCDTDCSGTCTACTATLKGNGKDGTCGPVEAGTNPGSVCTDDGAATCGGNGFCNGAGACGSYVDGTVCSGQAECVVAVCTGGVCGGPHELDGSPCTGGVCIAGTCVKDPTIGTGATSGSGGATTSSSSGSGNGAGATATGSGGSGAGGDGSQGEIAGGGCRVGAGGRDAAPVGGVMASLVLGFLAALRRRRER